MQVPLAHLDASVIEEVSLDLWRELFDAVGWPVSLAGKKREFSHEDVLQAFEQGESNDDLLLALEALNELGTEVGREAIVDAMNDRHVAVGILPEASSEREFALRLYLGQRSDASLADVFARAQTQIQEGGDRRRYHEFMGKDSEAVDGLETKRPVLAEATLQYCRDNDLGEHVHVRAFEDDGMAVFQIIRSHHTKKPLAVVRGSQARATIEYRPVHADVVRYEPAFGRLRIAARAASVVEFYRRAFGRVLFDDEMFFMGEPACNLRVLQERGRAAFANHGVYGVGHVWMTECLWERGDRELLHIRSGDCFRHIEELRLPITDGTLLQAKMKLQIAGKSTRPVTVTVRVPSRIEVTQKRHEGLVDQFLTTIGIRGARTRAAEADLWSLYPWRHPAAVWRSIFRGDTDTLITSGVLVPIQLQSVASPDLPGAGRVLAAQAVSDGEFYGVSRIPEVPSRSLSATDLDGLELNVEQFRRHLRSLLDISGASVPASNGQELLDLGVVEVGTQRLRLTYALRQPPSGAGDALRRLAAAAHAVLLMPTGQPDSSELAKVVLDRPIPKRLQVVRDAVAACGLTESVSAVFTAPDLARLVVDSKSGSVWIDGVQIDGFTLGTQPFRFVEMVARQCPTVVPTNALVKELSEGRQDGDTVVRHAKLAANKLIRAAMKTANCACSDPFPSAGGGYRCALQSYVV